MLGITMLFILSRLMLFARIIILLDAIYSFHSDEQLISLGNGESRKGMDWMQLGAKAVKDLFFTCE